MRKSQKVINYVLFTIQCIREESSFYIISLAIFFNGVRTSSVAVGHDEQYNGTKSRISKVTVILQCSIIRTSVLIIGRNNSETTLVRSIICAEQLFWRELARSPMQASNETPICINAEDRLTTDCDDLGTQQQHDIKQIDFKNTFQEYKNFHDLMLSTTQSQLHTLAIYLIWLINRKANKLNSFIRSIVLGMELELLLLRFGLHYICTV